MNPATQKINLVIIIAFAASVLAITQNLQASRDQGPMSESLATGQQQADLAAVQAAATLDQATAIRGEQIAIQQQMTELLTSIPLLGTPSSVGETLLIVPTPQTKPQDIAMIAEDTKIMSRILTKALREANLTPPASPYAPYAAKWDFFAHGMPSDQADALYIDDFGVIFFMKVDFPLAPGPQPEQETKTEEAADPVWARTKEEIYDPQRSRFARRTDRPDEEYVEQYDPEKVQTLKITLIETLKHAANMRTPKPQDSIILVIAGSADEPRDIDAATYAYTLTTGDRDEFVEYMSAPTEVGSSRAATLILRVRKSDVDDFAAGKLDMDQFTKKAEILTLCAHSAPSKLLEPEPTTPIPARR